MKTIDKLAAGYLFVIFATGAAFAQTPLAQLFPPAPRSAPTIGPKILPPPEYDYPYTGKLILNRVDTLEELFKKCPGLPSFILACTYLRKDNSCLVFMVADDIIRLRGWTAKILLRHEIGHCNGWPGDHPGSLPGTKADYLGSITLPITIEEQPITEEETLDSRTGIPYIHCPSGQVTEPCR